MSEQEDNWGAVEMGIRAAQVAIKARSTRGAALMLQSVIDMLSMIEREQPKKNTEGRS